jgi:uncharacterized protein (TIGR02996 family)
VADHTQFLDALAAQPEDDALRLVYADWLEEQGDPRAELLRLEVQRLAWPDAEGPPPDVVTRIQALRIGVGVAWLATVSRKGPYLAGLAAEERVLIKYTSTGCFHHSRCEFDFTPGTPLQVRLTFSDHFSQGGKAKNSTLTLDYQRVHCLDNLLEAYRLPAKPFWSTTSHHVDVTWWHGETQVFKESFVDYAGQRAGGQPNVILLPELIQRAFPKEGV